MNEPNPGPELDALFASARARRPDTARAEYAFETRLMARLREKQSTHSIWATVSWRLVPFFAVGVMALGLWHLQVISDVNDAAAFASTENSGTTEMPVILD